jgi:hypothetical protein
MPAQLPANTAPTRTLHSTLPTPAVPNAPVNTGFYVECDEGGDTGVFVACAGPADACVTVTETPFESGQCLANPAEDGAR